ncbi:hypothetical protein [Cloacibacillus porcorum]|uniref:hypothetical protein n=1 Tax=Cloacibacillus porcorum TaxID=1197717 RepID=UPI0023F14200|nr:hypothetical protein [Cloacibacillus porcorum]
MFLEFFACTGEGAAHGKGRKSFDEHRATLQCRTAAFSRSHGSGEYLQKGGRRNFLNVSKVIYGEGCENDKMTSSGSTGAGADFHASAQAAIRGFASLI